MDNIRWLKPVRPGDTLRVRLTVKEARILKSRANVGIVKNFWQVLNQDGDEVMQSEGYGMFLRRGA
jgi:acyl dehydratase